jgi:hypothetical protein
VVVTEPEDLVPDQLTERLRVRGALPFGRVTAVHAGERRTTILSTIVSLHLEYSANAPSEAPTRLLLKATRGGLDAGLRSVGEREVAFYSQASPLMPGGPFPRCYDAEYSSGRFHLLLEDLSETHMVLTEWPLPPNIEACERIVDTWATFHAFWWRHPSLGREVGTSSTGRRWRRSQRSIVNATSASQWRSVTVSGRAHERSAREHLVAPSASHPRRFRGPRLRRTSLVVRSRPAGPGRAGSY